MAEVEAHTGRRAMRAQRKTPNDRITWLDVARGIAMLMVVSSHSIEWTASETVSEASAWIHTFNGSAQLPVFFCVSGILFARSLTLDWRELMRRRVLPLLWVFAIWQPVVFAYKYAAGQFLPGQEDTSLGAHLMRLAASPVRPSGELWFLWALAIFVLVAYLTRTWPAAVQLALAGIVSALWFSLAPAVLGADVVRLLGPGLNGLVSYYFFFVAGILGAAMWKAGANLPKPALVGVVIVWIAVVACTRLTQLGDFVGSLFLLKLAGLVGCMSVAVLLARVSILQLIGKASINIYLIHTALIVGVLIVLAPWAPIPWDWWGTLALVLGATALGLAFYKVNQAGYLKWLVELPERFSRRLAAGGSKA